MTFTGPTEAPVPIGGGEEAQRQIQPPHSSPVEVKDIPRQHSRMGKRAITFYVKEDAFKQVRVLSVQTDKSLQELMQEAMDWLFREYGLQRIAKE